MRLRILMFYPGRVDQVPPILTSAICMADGGADVHLLTFGAAEPSARYLRGRGVELTVLRDRHPLTRAGKARLWLEGVLRLFQEKRRLNPDCLWHHQSAFPSWYALLPGALREVVVVAQMHEMNNDRPFRWYTQKALARRASLVIVPEVNRGMILKHFAHSDARFVVVPNRALEDALSCDEGPSASQVFREHGGSPHCRRLVIYQGVFMPDRRLDTVIEAFKRLAFHDVGLILLGADPAAPVCRDLARQAADDPRIVIVPRVAPPAHLRVARGCQVGVLLYAPRCLNNVYCAPNKIYEYAQSGLAMVLPDFPGLAPLAQVYRLGALCDPCDAASVARAMQSALEMNAEDVRSECARFLASSVRPEEAYREIHETLRGLAPVRRGEADGTVSRGAVPALHVARTARVVPQGERQ